MNRSFGSHECASVFLSIQTVKCIFLYLSLPGILRAYAKPAHFDALTFHLNDVIEHTIGAKFVWGEVKSINPSSLTAVVKPMCVEKTEEIGFDYCCICSGCNFNFLHSHGESLWY